MKNNPRQCSRRYVRRSGGQGCICELSMFFVDMGKEKIALGRWKSGISQTLLLILYLRQLCDREVSFYELIKKAWVSILNLHWIGLGRRAIARCLGRSTGYFCYFNENITDQDEKSYPLSPWSDWSRPLYSLSSSSLKPNVFSTMIHRIRVVTPASRIVAPSL